MCLIDGVAQLTCVSFYHLLFNHKLCAAAAGRAFALCGAFYRLINSIIFRCSKIWSIFYFFTVLLPFNMINVRGLTCCGVSREREALDWVLQPSESLRVGFYELESLKLEF